MSLSTTNNRINYTGNGVTTNFSFPYRFLANADLVVILRTIATGVEVTKVLNTDYTVSGANNQGGGTVTMLVAPTSLETLTILRDPDATQEADFVENDSLPAETLETQLDRAFMVMQRLQDKLDRSAILTDGNTVNFDPTLPALIVPETALIFNATGDGFDTGPSVTDIANAAANAAAAAASATAAAASATSASTSASAASTSAANAAVSETNAAQSAADAAAATGGVPWGDIVYKTFADSPIAITDADKGKTLAIDTSGGNVVVNLPQISSLSLTFPWVMGVKKTSTGDTNSITVNRGGSDKIDNVNSKVYSAPDSGGFIVPDTDGSPDNWTTLNFIGNNVVTLLDIQTMANKTMSGGFLTGTKVTNYLEFGEQVSGPTTPSSGDVRIYAKNDKKIYKKDSTGAEVPIGSGGGSGGVNFISLDSTWAPVKTDNFDLETSIGDWVTYQDAASDTPTDMTGGAPSITLSRTTTAGEVLNGTASLKVVKGAADEQGEGISCTAYIPLGYRGQVVSIQFPFKVLSGTLVDGDLRAYCYDITNSQIITPVNNYVTSGGVIKSTFHVDANTAQIRFGLHFASTAATAVTFVLDDIQVGPQEVVFGPTMTDWQSYTPTFTGFGTAANITFNWRQVGANIEIQGRFDTGTVTATEARISLPGNYSVKTGEVLGIRGQAGTSTGTNNDFSVIAEGGQSYLKFAQYNIGATGPVYEPVNGTNFPSSAPTSLFASFPIEGLSTNVVQQNAGMFSISNYLANGTRVTGTAPTKLGEYRSYLRDAGANTYTETSGSPATAPSATNGFILYADGSFAAGSTANNPTRYDIYVGKNKKVYYEFYSSTGRSGNIGVSVYQDSTLLYGYLKTENPDENGIISIYAPTLGTSTLHVPGIAQGQSPISPIYCDIFISDSVVPVQIGGKSEIYLTSGNGHGSTNTKIRRYSNLVKSFGSAISYTDSATDGASFQINQDGCYCITLTDVSAGGQLIGVSVNSTQLTTNIDSITNADRLINVLTQGASQQSSVSVTTLLNAGDIIRPHDEGSLNGASDNDSSFRITKVS